ncbi:MAG: FAD-dependent oxidoreductase [Balneolales bacterium]
MKVGIIGAGISGLTAGRILAKAGHDIKVFEKNAGYGGRIASFHPANNASFIVDHGASYLHGNSREFIDFLKELEDHQLITKWSDSLSFFSDRRLLTEHPAREPEPYYIAPEGMNSIGKYLGRQLDFYMSEKVGGLTHIGGSRINKSPWMINSSTINVFEADAVIIATPAIQAYGLVAASQDELALRRMITVLDDIPYTSTWSFIASYEKRDSVDWKGIRCKHPVLGWICNESSKRDTEDELHLVAHTSDTFTKKIINRNDPETLNDQIKHSLSQILGSWAGRPKWSESHYWKYHFPKKNLDIPYLESDDEHAPLALVGDYFQGSSMEAAYLSGLRLGNFWADKFS